MAVSTLTGRLRKHTYISLSGFIADGNPFYRFFAFPSLMETLFTNFLPFHRRWKLLLQIFCHSIADGNYFYNFFAFLSSMETLFKNVLPLRSKRKPFSKMFHHSVPDGNSFHKCFASPPETAVGAIQTVALRIKLILP
jgi:hypothetical protein